MQALVDTIVLFTNTSKAKDDMIKAYKKFNDIPHQKCVLLETFLNEESLKDYNIAFDLFQMIRKIQNQISVKLFGCIKKQVR